MSDDVWEPYLWDRSGEPDDELRRLESLLARYRFDQRATPLVPGSDARRDDEPDGRGD